MAALPTILETIDIGRASMYLMANDISKGQLFGKRLPSLQTTVLIGLVTDALKWQNETSPSDYDIWLCGKYGMEARTLSGGGTVIPIIPGTMPLPIEFIVLTSGSYMIEGQSSITITQFIGYNLIFNRNNIPQTMVNDGVNSYFTWNRDTGLFTVYGAATQYEIFSINAV
jgi:hypothetical protein